MKKKFYIWAGILLALILIAAIGLAFTLKRQSKNNSLSEKSNLEAIKLGPDAFGKLSLSAKPASSSAAPAVSNSQPSAFSRQESAAGGSAAGGSGTATGGIMRPYFPYKYVYVGGKIPAIPSIMDVFEKVAVQTPVASEAAKALKTFGLGLVNLSSFANSQASGFTLIQDEKYGYAITVDLKDGTVSINKNGQWPDTSCKFECPLGVQMQNSPTGQGSPNARFDSAKIISAASAFLQEHGINLSAYGKPEVSQNRGVVPYMVNAEPSAPSAPFGIATPIYANRNATIVYPLMINGMETYSGTGKAGLNVDYDTEASKISGVYGLELQRFESSPYELETNVDELIKYAENSVGFGNNPKEITVDLATPFIAYEQEFNYSNSESREIYVPCLVFAVKNAPSDYYGPKYVLVALPKDNFN